MTTPPTRARFWRRILLGALALVLVLAVAAAGLVYVYGPRFGVYLIPPTPQKYGEQALAVLDDGLYAEGPEWEKVRGELTSAMGTADSYEDLHPVIARAAKVAGGKHSRFFTPAETAQLDTVSAAEFKPPTVTTTSGASAANLGVTTVTLPALGTVEKDLLNRYAATAADGIDAAASVTCGYVVDLRGNTGGNMYPMLSGVVSLLPDGAAFSFASREGHTTDVTVQPDGVGVDNTVTSVGERAKHTDVPVAVLQDQKTASSGEAVATAFRGLPNARSFGTETAGYTSANVSPRLYDGAALTLTTAVYVDRTGTSLDEKPIQPDDPTTADAADEAAATWLASQGCPAAK